MTNEHHPAFPVHPEVRQDEPHAGMSLRDYFAAKAMQVFLANPNGMYSTDASCAYAMADAMLAERSKGYNKG